MYYVYLLESINNNQRYVGFTQSSVEKRLQEHNLGKSIHTNKFIPWKCVCYLAFEDKNKATEFEKYLKQGSGHAFAKKRLW